jgi:hypothetical protein
MPGSFEDFGSLEWHEDAPGRSEAILHRDAESKTYTRLVKITPNYKASDRPFTHEDFDEVVYVIEGRMRNPRTGEVYEKGAHAYFRIGQEHGPFDSPDGCLNIEFRHYKV